MYVIFLLELGFEKEAEDEEEEEEEDGEEVGMARREKCGGEERICGDGKRVPKLSVLDFLLRFRWWCYVRCTCNVGWKSSRTISVCVDWFSFEFVGEMVLYEEYSRF